MDPNFIVIFVGIIVAACITGGAIYSGLDKIAQAINSSK